MLKSTRANAPAAAQPYPYRLMAATAILAAATLAMPVMVHAQNTSNQGTTQQGAASSGTEGAPAQAAAPDQGTSAGSGTAMHHMTSDHRSKASHAAVSMKPGSVEARIRELHAELKITPDEESAWNDVAQAMRDNAASMEKLIAETRQQGPQNRNAVDDLKAYQQFAEAHVDGLKRLTPAFETLYDKMSPEQKKHADRVFQSFSHEHHARS
jgi:periplasmic protein CpxP/Spy